MQIVFFIAYIALGIVQFFAFIEGLEVWFGFGIWLSVLAFAVVLFIGPLGNLAIAVVGFYGAWKGWGWEWWQAALLCFPFVILAFAVSGVSGLLSLFSRND